MVLGPRRLEQADQQLLRDKPAERAPDLRVDGDEVHFLTFCNSELTGYYRR